MRLLSRSFFMAAAVVAASALSTGVAGAQAAATVCKDGTTSATTGRGACSGHGGVASKSGKAAKPAKGATTVATPAPKAATAATVSCADGTMSKGGRGACSGHGGVKSATTVAAPVATPPAAKPAKTASAAPARSTASNTTAGSGAKEDNNPTGAIAKCKDGLFSHATHRQGACSRHGGVASWM